MDDNEKIAVILFASDLRSQGFDYVCYTGPDRYKNVLTSCMSDPRGQKVQGNLYFFYGLKTLDEGTLFLAKSNKIKYGRNAGLSLGLFVPKAYKLVDNPYDVLNALLKYFQKNFMEKSIMGGWAYKTLNIDEKAFDSEVQKYGIVSLRAPHRPMSGGGVGTLYVPQDKMQDLFADVSYEDFQKYSEILISNVDDEDVLKVEIPRVKKYKLDISSKEVYGVTVNGGPFNTSDTISNPDDRIVVYSKQDSLCYEPAMVDFTIRDLLEDKRIDHVEFCPEEETIKVDMPKSPEKTNRYKISFRNAAEDEFLNKGAFGILKINGNKFSVSRDTYDAYIEITGLDNRATSLEVEPVSDSEYTGFKYKWTRCRIDSNNMIALIYTEPILPKPMPPDVIADGHGDNRSDVNNDGDRNEKRYEKGYEKSGKKRGKKRGKKSGKKSTSWFPHNVVAVILALAVGIIIGLCLSSKVMPSHREITETTVTTADTSQMQEAVEQDEECKETQTTTEGKNPPSTTEKTGGSTEKQKENKPKPGVEDS